MDEPMKRLSDLLQQMNAISPVESTPISSSPDFEPTPVQIFCYDPEHPTLPCPICKGLGVVKYPLPPEHPKFGKLHRCPNRPVEADLDHQERLRRLSNLKAFADKTFENFELDLSYSDKEHRALISAQMAALKFAETMDGWLLLEGSYGTGKTHLAAAVGNYRLRFGEHVLFITTPDLLDYLRGTFSPNSEQSYDDLFERIKNSTLLILDDLGVENPSEWSKEKLFQLLNYRYSHNKPTVITTNISLDELDPRIRSRLMDNTVIHRIKLEVPDYRNNTPNSRQTVLQSRLPAYAHMTFDNFELEDTLTVPEHDNLLKAAQAAAQFANEPENWLLFIGGYGTGKTHLAAAIANHRRNLGDEVMMLTAPELLDYLLKTFNPDYPIRFDKMFQQIQEAPLLVLDDLGSESGKEWSRDKLFQILDYRYLTQKPTVMTTSKKFDDLNPRLVSRLIDKRLCRNIAITVPSYAERMKRR